MYVRNPAFLFAVLALKRSVKKRPAASATIMGFLVQKDKNKSYREDIARTNNNVEYRLQVCTIEVTIRTTTA